MLTYKWFDFPTITKVRELLGVDVVKFTTGMIDTGDHYPDGTPIFAPGVEVVVADRPADEALKAMDLTMPHLKRPGGTVLKEELDRIEASAQPGS